MDQYEIDKLKAKNICHRCVGEAFLNAEIRKEGRRRKCAYCGTVAKSYGIDVMAERIDEVFETHYRRTSDQPNSWQQSLLSDKESDYDWERDGEPVVYAIAGAADIPEEAAEHIQKILEEQHDDFEAAQMGEETAFSSESSYEEKGTSDVAWREEWRAFEQSLKTEARFFSKTATEHLGSVFGGLDLMRARDGRPLVVDAGPGAAISSIFRARVFQSDELLEMALCRPDQQLGSPPATLARAGRMNAAGISVFYGASDPKAAIAEVRPPVGSQVAIACFEIVRPLRLLDLTAFNSVSSDGSVFDPAFSGRLEREMFLRSLSGRIARAVMPDTEAFEYLPTQAIADYLATAADTLLDGILFPSVQLAGDVLNIVLFHKAARVENLNIPKGTELSARTGSQYEDGWEREYSVSEEVPPEIAKTAIETNDETVLAGFTAFSYGFLEPSGPDSRNPSLRIILDSIKVHVVQKVSFETTEFDVRRHRWEKREVPF